MAIFLRFAPLRSLASLCNNHCSTCVAQGIRAMMIWLRPRLPPIYIGSFFRVLSTKYHWIATKNRGCVRYRTKPNISRHELTTTMQHLSNVNLCYIFYNLALDASPW